MNEHKIPNVELELNKIEQVINQILENLSGHSLSVETLAHAVSKLCINIPVEVLQQDCKELLEGIQSGSAYAEKLLEMSKEELEAHLPEYLKKELKEFSYNEQHQYLIILYQCLNEKMGRSITSDEAIRIANTTNDELHELVTALVKQVQIEVTDEIAEMLDDSSEDMGNKEKMLGNIPYTQEEYIWILSAAMYVARQKNSMEKIPAVLIGESIGASFVTGQSFRNCMLSKVIPTAVSALAVAATCALTYLCIKALVTHQLVLTVLEWAKAHHVVNRANMKMFVKTGMIMGTTTIIEPARNILETIWDTTFTATAALTCRFMKDESRENFQNDFEKIINSENHKYIIEQNNEYIEELEGVNNGSVGAFEDSDAYYQTTTYEVSV